MKKMCIYEPALCCETGLCGVNVDPEFLRISTVLNTLKKEGVVIGRYNLKNAPMEFVKNDTVNQYINEKGVEGLPVITLDDEIVISGRYPENEEILTLLELPANILLGQNGEKASGDCCGESAVEESCCCDGSAVEESCCCDETGGEGNCCDGDCC